MKSAFALLFMLGLVGCSSDEGYVSVRVAPAPATNARAAGLSAVQLSTDTPTPTADSSVLVTSDLADSDVGIVASEIGGMHLWVTVTDVNVKVKGKKHGHGHGHGHGQCNDGDEHGSMHEGAGDEMGDDGEHDNGDHHDDGDQADQNDDDHDGGHHDGGHDGHEHGRHHGAWTNIFSGDQRVDLLDTSAAGSFLAGGNVPTGMLRELRIVLTGDITLVHGAMSWPVQCPSCSTSGLKIKTHGVNVIDGGELALSVDVSHALSGDPTTGYVLHPVIRLQSVTCPDHGDDDGEHDDGEHGD